MQTTRVDRATAPRRLLPAFPSFPALGRRPLVSICITSHDYERYVGTAVDSALAQTYRNVEVIVVDDGSTDGSRTVLAGYGDRIRLVLQENRGQVAAAQHALEHTSGEIVIFLDADDTLEPTIVGTAVAAFVDSPAPAPTLVQWRLRTIDEAGHDVGHVRPPRAGLMSEGDLRPILLSRRNWHAQLTSGVAYRMAAVRRVLPVRLPPNERNALDHYFNSLLPLFGPVRSLDVIGGSYRAHDNSASSTDDLDGAYPRRMMRMTVSGHADVVRVAPQLGLQCPGDPDELLDPAFFGWRLWSLKVEPGSHPYPADRGLVLAGRGLRATVGHPPFPTRHKVKRGAWFLALGLAPARLARRILERWTPDGPRVRAGRLVG